MIGCDKCEQWFHAQCFSIDLLSIPDIDKFDFLCPDCGGDNKYSGPNQNNEQDASAV